MNKGIKIFFIIVAIACFLLFTAAMTVFKKQPNNVVTPVSYEDNNNNNGINNDLPTSKPNGGGEEISVEDLKKEFGEEDSSKYAFKPFYNVEQTTEFTFRFKSNVDPMKAITVHTDSRCLENSTVFQFNDGYKTADGVDVVVKPYEPVLGARDRKDYVSKGIWGYAPIYYLCVRYDLDSTTVKKLDEPIIIPFTIKNEITTPTAYVNISNDGMFSVDWLKVDGASEYKIYSVSMPSSKVREFTREEVAYCADGNKMRLLKTVPANVTSYVNESLKPGNVYTQTSGYNSMSYVSMQNYSTGYTYYVTAVDSKGNESFFSKAICDWMYLDVIPYSLDSSFIGALTEFPDTVKLRMANNTVKVDYPINFYKVGEEKEYSNNVYYRYEIPNTKLTGYVEYKSESRIFPKEHLSSCKTNNGDFYKDHLPEIAPVSVPQIVDSDYANSSINLKDKVNYPESAKIQLDSSALLKRTDMESSRYINDGVYTQSLDSIPSYVASSDSEYIVVRRNGKIQVVRADEYVEDPVEPSKPAEPTKPQEPTNVEPVKPQEPTYVEPVKPQEPTKPAEPTKPQEPETIVVEKPVEEITNDNYVEIQKESTKKDVEEGNKEKVSTTNYPIIAQTAGQKYLALNLINHVDDISLKAFPEYQNINELIDDLHYVWYQNPYIMTLVLDDSTYTYEDQVAHIKYGVDANTTKRYQEAVAKKAKEVANSILKPSMSDYDKTIAIYEYLEKNGTYYHDAINYAYAGNKDFYYKYANSWNTYGILCENLGVCQSYAYAYNAIAMEGGLESIMVTGALNNGGHAWNASKINGKWYIIDATNNNKYGNSIPYWFVNIGKDLASKSGFVCDDGFVDGLLTEYNYPVEKVSDIDWYKKNGLYASTISDVARIVKDNENNDLIFFKYDTSNINFGLEYTFTQLGNELMNNGADIEKISNMRGYNMSYGIYVFANDAGVKKMSGK